MKRILVTGASGKVGHHVAVQLHALGATVRALARRPEALDFPPEIERAQGDFNAPESLDDALADVEAVFLVWTAPLPAAAPALSRIARQVRRVVYLSAPLKTPHPLFQQPNPMRAVGEQIEQLIEGSGLTWTYLRPGMFAANSVMWWAPLIRRGNVVRWPYAQVPTAPIHEKDIAAVAVCALLEEGHGKASYVLTGPQALTQAEQLETIGQVIRRPLRMDEISRETAQQELLSVIPSAAVVKMLLDAWAAAQGHPAYVTNTVEEITGTPARTFRDWVTEHAADFS